MNFQCYVYNKPINVIVVNPLTSASKLILIKIMSGFVFGISQLIDLTLLVSEKDVDDANHFKSELLSCAFSYTHSITIISDIPSVLVGDVICCISNLTCTVNFDDGPSKEQIDMLFSMVKIADSLSLEKDQKTPIIMADSLVAMDVLHNFSRNMPYNVFFCPTFLTTIAKNVLCDYLKVKSTALNIIYVWAANDKVFHIEVDKPVIVNDEVENTNCTRDMGGKNILKKFNNDSTKFSTSWMRKEFSEKVASSVAPDPYGCVYKAAVFAQSLKDIWRLRMGDVAGNVNLNAGVISDGSFETIKGCPYVLPIMLSEHSWSTRKHFEDNIYLKQEIKRINKASKLYHEKLVNYCTKWYEDYCKDVSCDCINKKMWTKM